MFFLNMISLVINKDTLNIYTTSYTYLKHVQRGKNKGKKVGEIS